MTSVTIFTEELDSASNRVLVLVWGVPSVVRAMWRITWRYIVGSKGYLDGSNCKQQNSRKRTFHLQIYSK